MKCHICTKPMSINGMWRMYMTCKHKNPNDSPCYPYYDAINVLPETQVLLNITKQEILQNIMPSFPPRTHGLWPWPFTFLIPQHIHQRCRSEVHAFFSYWSETVFGLKVTVTLTLWPQINRGNPLVTNNISTKFEVHRCNRSSVIDWKWCGYKPANKCDPICPSPKGKQGLVTLLPFPYHQGK